MNEFSKLSALMKADWDRRVSHDYRFWMSDGYESDEAMWQSGERDFAIICEGLQNPGGLTFLELGCGVGRILRAARGAFAEVYGVDVSEKAIQKARELLSPDPGTLHLIVGNGVDLHEISDESIDVAASFAALTSIPTDVIALYLSEFNRVLKPGGIARLQVYFGREQDVRVTDTLHVRCFERRNFETAVALAGFELEWVHELQLPFQVSYREAGFEAFIVSLRKSARAAQSYDVISRALLPQGEKQCAQGGPEENLEYWVAVNHANELAERGEIEEAERALEYATQFTKTATIDIRDMLHQVGEKIERLKASRAENAASFVSEGNHFDKNLAVLRERFPQTAQALMHGRIAKSGRRIEVRATAEGPVLFVDGQCLDHPAKPVSAAKSWAARVLKEERFQSSSEMVVFDFGSGYHIEALLEAGASGISAIAAEPALLAAAMEHRDLSGCLRHLRSLRLGDDDWSQDFGPTVELVVRPQAQVLDPKLCQALKERFYGTRGLTTLHPQIGVLGPVQGGTLPIMGYTARSLATMNQRIRILDVSEFATGYHAVGSFINNDLLKANAQGSYVQMISQLVLHSVTEKPVDILICMALAPITAEVLTELRRRGVITAMWFVEDYQRFKTWEGLAPYFDFIFTIQRGECI